ncbi:MAG: 2-dehydropantoate 2-reductase [Reyranella sp.]|jgi:2-dehydropantoate 2-reductase|nr:2-dehydropantoate 2-reductase [Reyranella sp.]
MRFLVLGAGALGGYFGARLIKGGADVTFLVRPRREQQLERDGLVVHTQDGETLRYKVRTVQQGGIDKPFDAVLLACKAYDLDSAMDAIAPAVIPGTAILPVLNGMRHIDVLKQRFGTAQVLGGITGINATLLADGTIRQSQVRINMNHLGELDRKKSARSTAIAGALTTGGLPAEVVDDIAASMWQKFFGFTCNATLATLTRSRAGAIAKAGAGAAFVSAVMGEVASVVAGEGDNVPSELTGLISGMFARPDSTYLPSILVDMEAGRPTEGEHTIGDMVDRANRRGIAVPILTAARCNLQAYEINRQQVQR